MGYVESALDPCLMLLPARSGPLKLDGVVLLDVDDFLQGGTARHHRCMEELRMELKFGKWKQHRGEFLGRTVTQLQSFEIQVCMKLYVTEKMSALPITRARARETTTKCDSNETTLVRGGGGSLLWLGREGRPDLAGKAALVMSWTEGSPTVQHLLDANHAIAEAKAHPDTAVRILPIPVASLCWLTVSDASLANLEGGRSQGGYAVAATDASLAQGREAPFSLITWKSKRVRRVVKASLGSEAQALDDALGELEWVRAIWSEMTDPQSNLSEPTLRYGRGESVVVVQRL